MGETVRRSIRSFVLRQGRVSNAQRSAYEKYSSDFCIPYAEQLLQLNEVFGRDAPKILEIGFGMGETTAAIAAANQQIDYLGVEVHTPGVGGLLKLISELQLKNIRIIQHDAVEVIQHMVASQSLDGIHIFFPDPWQKQRHHKRRLIQSAFVDLLCERLKPGGYIHVATDWQNYAEHILKVLSNEKKLKNKYEMYADRPGTRPVTRFEQKGLRKNHPVWDMIFERLS
jgi:tRNA (guanine-N7-)-methyltransferase